MKTRIKVGPKDLDIVRGLLEDGHKIKAIKHLRSTGKSYPGVVRDDMNTASSSGVEQVMDHRVGLRDAKHACEALTGTITKWEAAALITPALKIKKVVVEGEHGDVELDLDELQLRILDGLGVMTMTEMAELTGLMTFLRDWEMKQ